MRICLINVPNTYELVGNDPVIIKDQQGMYPPLGLLYTSSYINQRGQHHVDVVDSQAQELDHKMTAERVAELKPDLIGLTAMTFTLVDCKLVIQELRKRLPGVPIVVGGPHTAIFPEESLLPTSLGADYVVVGEGEITLNDLATDIEMGKPKGRIYRQISFIQNLDELPFADYDAVDINDYYSVLAEETPSVTLFTSRGCPFSCSYCLGRLTNILTDDLKWKKISEFKVGDGIIGIKESSNDRTFYVKGKVTHIFPVRKEMVYRITTEDGSVEATANHEWLTDHKRWRNTFILNGKKVRFLCEPSEVEETIDYKQGYVCGALKGDGYFKRYRVNKGPNKHNYYSHRVRLVGDVEMMDTVKKYSEELEVAMHYAHFNGGHYKLCTRQLVTHTKEKFEKIEQWFNNDSPEYKRGFLAGFFDADGSWTSALRFHGQDLELLKHIQILLKEQGFESKISEHYQAPDKKFRGHSQPYILSMLGGLKSTIRFCSWAQPKVLKKLSYWNNGIQVLNSGSKVISVKPIGVQEVYNIETTCHTYIANGFISHNCDRPALGKGFRPQGAMRVVDEMEALEKRGAKEIFFYDDTFSVSMKRVDAICDEYIKRKLTIKWDIRTRVNVVNEELLKKMKKAGCERIHFGVESGNPRIVRTMNKGVSIKQVEQAFDVCKRIGIKTLAYFMMGNPGETLEDVKDTLRLSQRIKPDFMQMTILSPFPATKYYLDALKDGVIDRDVWKEYAANIDDGFRPPLWTQPGGIYSRQELESHLRWFYGKFYLNPKFIFDRIMEVRNMGQFKRYASAGMSLIAMTCLPEKKLKDSWGLRTRTGVASSTQPESAVAIN